jgi:hypothetical protein
VVQWEGSIRQLSWVERGVDTRSLSCSEGYVMGMVQVFGLLKVVVKKTRYTH